MASDALRRSREIEKTLRHDDRVQDCEVLLIETPDREKHVVNVLMKPEAEEIEMHIDSVPISSGP